MNAERFMTPELGEHPGTEGGGAVASAGTFLEWCRIGSQAMRIPSRHSLDPCLQGGGA
jgi:hypothetical protein